MPKTWDLHERMRQAVIAKEMQYLYGVPADAVLRTWWDEAATPRRRHPVHRFVKWAARR